MTINPMFILAGAAAGFASYLPLKRLFDNRHRRMSHNDETKLGEGIILQDGESASLEFDVPPEIAAALEAGCQVEVEQGEDRYVGDGSYERELVVLVDGQRKGCFRLRWKPVDLS